VSKADYLELGDWNAACYECGMKFKASQLRRHWKGYYVCQAHYEPRQPQDFVRGIPDIQTPPWVQDWTNTFIDVPNMITIQNWTDAVNTDLFAIAIGTETNLPLLTE
jgi:hypothetical protein